MEYNFKLFIPFELIMIYFNLSTNMIFSLLKALILLLVYFTDIFVVT